MKISFQTVLLLVAVFLSHRAVHATGSDSQYRLIRLHYNNTSGEKGVTTFDYSQDGKIQAAVWELLDGSRSSLNDYSYSDGNLVKKYREFSDSLTSSLIYHYNESGLRIGETFERSDGVTGHVKYEHDDHGKVRTAHCEGMNGWFFGTIHYRYNTKGQKVSGDIIQKTEQTGIIHYTYNNEGNLEKEMWDFSGKWGQTFIYEYDRYPDSPPVLYTSSNVFLAGSEYRVIQEVYTYSGETGGPSFYEYNSDGKLITKTFVRSDSLKTVTRYLYDGQGRLIKSYRQMSNGLVVIFDYEYDAAGNMIKRTFKRSDSAAGSEWYEYNPDRILSKACYDQVDFWLTGDICFSHNDAGMLTSGAFKGTEGFDARIFFTYDNRNRLIKIHWDFSFGKTQTYFFQYE